MVKGWFAKVFSKHLVSDHEAHRRAAQLNTSTNEVHLQSELKKYKNRASKAEKHVAMFSEMSSEIIKLALMLPNDQMIPFVHQVVLLTEQRMRYIKQP